MKLVHIQLCGALLASALGTAFAAPLTGTYLIGGGTVNLDAGSVNTATTVNSFSGATLTLGSSDLAPFTGQAVTFTTPWSFNSGPISNFWSTGGAGGLQFNLTSSSITSQGNGAINVDGIGTLFIKNDQGGTSNTYTFNFTSQDPGIAGAPPTANFTYSISGNAIPDGGATSVLLGLALVGLAIASRKLKRS